MQSSILVESSGVFAPEHLSRDDRIAQLAREHTELETRLSDLNGRLYLSPDEEIERKTLQKMKLAKKDRMAFLVNYSGTS